jgi:hypothetical protein
MMLGTRDDHETDKLGRYPWVHVWDMDSRDTRCGVWMHEVRGDLMGHDEHGWNKRRSRRPGKKMCGSRAKLRLQESTSVQSMNTFRAVVTATFVEIHIFGAVGVTAITM